MPATAASTCLGTKPSAEHFTRWAKKREIFLHPDVAFLVPTKTMGMGVFACRPLAAGTVIISCPSSASLSPYTEPTPEAPSIAVLQAYQQHSAQHQLPDNALIVVMRLMAELCRKTSPWKPWLEVCPRMEHHLFNLTPAQKEVFALLQKEPEAASADNNATSSLSSSAPATDASAVAGVNQLSWTGLAEQLREMNVDARWAEAQKLISDHPNVWPAHLATFELFCECLAQVSSRNFHRESITGREGPYLLPGLDIINHSFASNAEFSIRGGGRKHEASFTVLAARPLLKGEQVFCSYGHIGASRFAVEFQFITKSVVREDMTRFSARCLAELMLALRIEDVIAAAKDNGGSAEDEALEERDAFAKDMEKRVEQLQRLGFLFDEGLYLVRPLTAADFPEGMDAEELEATLAKRAMDVDAQLRVFLSVVHLLSVNRGEFVDLFHHITLNWHARCTPVLRSMCARVLKTKRHATAAQLSRVKEDVHVFCGDVNTSNEASLMEARRALVIGVLESEQEILFAYEELVKTVEDIPEEED